MLRIVTLIAVFIAIVMTTLWSNERDLRMQLASELKTRQVGTTLSIKQEHLAATGLALPRPTAVTLATITPIAQPTIQPQMPVGEQPPSLPEMSLYGVESRLSAMNKLFTLTVDQQQRLRQKYTEESAARRAKRPANAESLREIIGDTNAEFFQQQVTQSLEKAKSQELDREIYYVSRKLALTQPQEEQFRTVLAQVEKQVDETLQSQRSSPQFKEDPSYRVRLMIQENNLRTQQLSQELKRILSPDQYQAYLQEEADSAAAELGMWHAP